MPPKPITSIEPKATDPEAELSNVQRMFLKLAPMCSVAKRAQGVPQLAPQEKQLGILTHEMQETVLCIDLGRKGQHAVRDATLKAGTLKSILEYEHLMSELRDENSQQTELDCLNYLASKQIIELLKYIPTEADELEIIENANNRLRRMENRLDLAIKRFCVVNTNNMEVRHEIHRLLVERNQFNVEWNRTISKLVKGKEFLMDILEIASIAFGDRDECCRKLEALKWKGLYQLNRDIAEMQSYESELNHLAKAEEFLRIKGSRRICEADEKEEIKRLEETQQCEELIAEYDALLENVFTYANTDRVLSLLKNFKKTEINNFGIFVLICEILQESIIMRKDLEILRQKILDQRDMNEARDERQGKHIDQLKIELEAKRESTTKLRARNEAADAMFQNAINGINTLVVVSNSRVTPLLSLLGNHKEVTRWNVYKFLKLLEFEVKELVEVVYSAVKPPPPMPAMPGKGKVPAPTSTKLVQDPTVTQLRPNAIESLVSYLPCAYCVEDYIMNLVFETPAVPADPEYVQGIFHLEDTNTRFGIYTLTIPAKRHPYRAKN